MADKTTSNRKLKTPVTQDRGELRNGRLSQIKNHLGNGAETPNEFYSKKE